jgi:hypothetical protein
MMDTEHSFARIHEQQAAIRLPKMISLPESAFETLTEQVKAAEKSLGPAEAVTLWIASFGHSVHLQVKEIRLEGMHLCLTGNLDDGSEAVLIQHYTQTSLLVMKSKPVVPVGPIGFTTQ